MRMVYREISVSRVMRKIAIDDIERLYFQDRDANKTLRKLNQYDWRIDEFKKFKFFELEGDSK